MTDITEEWARTAPAGFELNEVCAEWMGGIMDRNPSPMPHAQHDLALHRYYEVPHRPDGTVFNVRRTFAKDGGPSHLAWKEWCEQHGIEPVEMFWAPRFSDCWSCAGPLLEAMEAMCLTVWSDLSTVDYTAAWSLVGGKALFVEAPTPSLAIARACGVLVARGVSRADMGAR